MAHKDDGLTLDTNRKNAPAGRGATLEQPRKQRLSFTTDQWVPFPVDRVFAFFADPLNLPRLMPAWQDARIDSLELQTPGRGASSHTAGPRLAHSPELPAGAALAAAAALAGPH